MHSVRGSATKEKRAVKSKANQLVKLKLQDSSDMRPQASDSVGQAHSKYANTSQPSTTTHQQAAQFKQVKKAPQASSARPRASERSVVPTNAGQKSVTNRYTKILAGANGLDNPQIHQLGISSATNKIKKSFNFEVTQEHSLGGDDTRLQDHHHLAFNPASKQDILNQLLLFKQANVDQGRIANAFASNSSVPGAGAGKHHQQNQMVQPRIYQKGSKQAKVQNMKNQQLLLMQQQLAQAQQTSQQLQVQLQTANSVSNSRKALNATGPVPKATHSTAPNGQGKHTQASLKRQSASNKVAKSVGQSKPPAHAQYFESAAVPSKGSKAGGQGSGPGGVGVGVNRAHGSTAITTQGGNTVININIDNGGAANYIHQGALQAQVPFASLQQQQQQAPTLQRNGPFTHSQFLEQQQKQAQGDAFPPQQPQDGQQFQQLAQPGLVIGPNVSKAAQLVPKQETSQESILLQQQQARKDEGLVAQAVSKTRKKPGKSLGGVDHSSATAGQV